MCSVQDGYITGAFYPHQRNCERCGERTKCIEVIALTLPEGVTFKATILWDKVEEDPIKALGVGCGCYAKFHRQVAHIADSRMRSGHAV